MHLTLEELKITVKLNLAYHTLKLWLKKKKFQRTARHT